MDTTTLENIVRTSIMQATNGQEVERSKIDFKSKWYDLKNLKNINDFVKDTSAIANSFGPDGFIIIGFDAKTKVFHPAKFRDSQFTDTSLLIDLLGKKITEVFQIDIHEMTFNGSDLSVIHIPPSINKPHVIRNFQKFSKNGEVIAEEPHRIFVRKGSTNQVATKYDIELMYYDRKNIVPEYELHANIEMDSVVPSSGGGECHVRLQMTIENSGRRPVSISEVRFRLDFKYDDFMTHHSVLNMRSFPSNPIIVKAQEMTSELFEFRSVETFRSNEAQARQELRQRRDLREALEVAIKDNFRNIVFDITFSNGNALSVKPFFSERKK